MPKSSDSRSTAPTIAIFASWFLMATISTAGDGPIKIAREAPYDESRKIAEYVVEECTQLGSKFGRFLEEHAKKHDVPTEIVDELDPEAEGRVLVAKFTNAHSRGNAFFGHRESMSATAPNSSRTANPRPPRTLRGLRTVGSVAATGGRAP